MAGYHLRTIPSGKLGTSSKILEEVLELQDAEEQSSKIMVLVELADIYGALESYLAANHPTMTMLDLKRFSDITKRAFTDGTRSSK